MDRIPEPILEVSRPQAVQPESLRLSDLRTRYPRFIYRAFHFRLASDALHISFDFECPPELRFTPTVTLPIPADFERDSLESREAIELLAFHLGLIEMISYWKATCSPIIEIHPYQLTSAQLAWWHDLFIHGLGEFYFRNQIDFSTPDFLTFTVAKDAPPPPGPIAPSSRGTRGELLLLGGGKDSCVALDLVKSDPHYTRPFILSRIPSAIETARVAGFHDPLFANRTIDARLITLNGRGFLNGHTPFSAYLAFLSTLMAWIYAISDIIVANEASANESNAEQYGVPINHQYSKSFRFEKMFREYSRSYLTPDISYWSILRPLLDLQVSALFAKSSKFHPVFRSCNVQQREGSWCRSCPKCVFVALTLAPFLSEAELIEIFGRNLLTDPTNLPHIRDLIGLGNHKPFECVGTERESQAALTLWCSRPDVTLQEGSHLTEAHEWARQHMPLSKSQELLHAWNSEHALPSKYETLLRQRISGSWSVGEGRL